MLLTQGTDLVAELETLNAEIKNAELRLLASDKEGQKIIERQIQQIRRDIQRYSKDE